MYLKLKLHDEEEFSKKKKRTIIWVIIFHVIILVTIFLVFTLKGCARKKPQQIINVSLAGPVQKNTVQMEPTQKVRPQKKIQEQPKKNIKKQVKKVPQKKKWEALDPNQIVKTNKTFTKKREIQPVKKYTPVKASEIAKNLRKGIKTIKFNNSFNANASVLTYYDEISEYLYDRWDQPSRAVLGGRMPVVNIKVSVDSSGRILNYSIVKASGINAMDSSVKTLLEKLRTLPAPPDGAMTIDISLELEN